MVPSVLRWVSTHSSSVIAAVTAFFGILTYRRNVRVRTAEFLSELHQAFFVDDTYKGIRDQLDQDTEIAYQNIDTLLDTEPAVFTDFLNFFELVAYFYRSRTLSKKALEALLGYYLNLLNSDVRLRAYIRDPQNDFENLDRLLKKSRKNRRL